jgi:hypothetical protein
MRCALKICWTGSLLGGLVRPLTLDNTHRCEVRAHGAGHRQPLHQLVGVVTVFASMVTLDISLYLSSYFYIR